MWISLLVKVGHRLVGAACVLKFIKYLDIESVK